MVADNEIKIPNSLLVAWFIYYCPELERCIQELMKKSGILLIGRLLNVVPMCYVVVIVT